MILFVSACDGSSDDTKLDADPDVVDNSGSDGEVDADTNAETPKCDTHIFEEISIPMADGAELSAFVRRAGNEGCTLPTILIQSPYNKENGRTIWFNAAEPGPLFASMDYNFVVLDWRGFFGSAGQPNNPDRTHNGFDGYDAVEWIADQPWSDGKVGTWGISALCTVQYQTAQLKPPSLKAMVPIFCSMNNSYEQHYPGGVLRREYINFISTYYGVSAQLYEDHPFQDNLWNYLGSVHKYFNVEAPALVVAGWYDLYNTGTMHDWRQLRTSGAANAREQHRLLIGPWIHGAMGGETSMGRPLTEQELKYVDSDFIAQERSLRFFDYHLRDLGSLPDEPVEYMLDQNESYEVAADWPPSSNSITFYLSENGELTETVGIGDVQYLYDPDDPSPTIGGQTLMGNLSHGPHWQDDVIVRGDGAVYASAPLTEPLSIAGPVTVTLRITTTGLDTDFAARLTMVNPEGHHLLIGEGIRRLKLRDTYATPSEVTPNTQYTIEIPLTNDAGFTYLPGDKVGLIITSANYPRFDINPNTGDDFYTNAVVPITATNTLHHGDQSQITLTLNQ